MDQWADRIAVETWHYDGTKCKTIKQTIVMSAKVRTRAFVTSFSTKTQGRYVRDRKKARSKGHFGGSLVLAL